MWGLLLVGLLIFCVEALITLWPILLLLVAVFGFQFWMGRPVSAAAEREAREALRHEQARREIGRITLATTRAMYEAATNHADVIDATAIEIERR